mmetsp:Transcript_19327/g.40507  ORF Transcript_19327/g.40507 Transcript_19327/m.40507 type:complete len:572 (-) Transcript_19327:81-1796(-)
MKHYKDAIIHGAQLFRYLKGQQTSENDLSRAAKLPLGAARTAARALSRIAAEEDEDFLSSFALGEDESGDDVLSALLGGGDDESEGGGGGDMFSNLSLGALGLGGEDGDMDGFMETFEQCGIDVSDLASKAMGAFFMYGSGIDMSSPESIMAFDSYGPMLTALKDEDENECSETDEVKFVSAIMEYSQCSGISAVFDPEESAVTLQILEDDCKPVFDMVVGGDVDFLQLDDLDENSAFGESLNQCLKSLLGDNPIGNFIRYEYNHMDKILGCFGKLSEDLPHCVLSVPVQDGDPVSFPLSLEEKLTCLIGSSYEGILEGGCLEFFGNLDMCLPLSGDATTDVDHVDECAELGIPFGKLDDLLGMDVSVVTGDKMPDFCSKIFEENGLDAEDVQSRLESYNENREYGWTIETIANEVKVEVETVPENEDVTETTASDVKVEVEAVPVVPENEDDIETIVNDVKVEVEAVPENEYGGDEGGNDKVSIAMSQALEKPEALHTSTWTDGEAAPEDDDSLHGKYFPFVVIGSAISAMVLLALVVKRFRGRASRERKQPIASRKEYSNLGMKMGELA